MAILVLLLYFVVAFWCAITFTISSHGGVWAGWGGWDGGRAAPLDLSMVAVKLV